MLYTLTITPDDGKDIIKIGSFGDDDKIEKNLITGIDIKLDTTDDNVRQKSNAMLAKITVYGEMKNEVTKKYISLFEWAKEQDQKRWYRTVEIEIKSSQSDIVRSYKFEKMFVVDYKEFYKEEKNDNKDTFELVLTQKENNLDNIDTYPY